MTRIKYRPAAESDMDAAVELWREIHKSHAAYDPQFYQDLGERHCRSSCREYFKKLLADPAYHLFVAASAGEVVGLIVAHFVTRPPIFVAKRQAAIETAVVRADCRRRGVFRGLLRCIEEKARAEGIEMAVLNVHHRNPARLTYEHAGFSTLCHSMVKWLK